MNIEVAPKETEIQADWGDAVLYCQFLAVDGKTGWRLPTNDELNYIYNSDNDLNENCSYWSSTEFDDYTAWVRNMFVNGLLRSNKLDRTYVRAIRDIK